MTDPTAQQLADIVLPLFKLEPELRPTGLRNESSFGGFDRKGKWSSGYSRVENSIQLCESSMVRWLANNGLAPGIAKDEYYAPGENRFSVCLNMPSLGISWAPTLVEALAAACNAYLDAKETNDEH